MPPPLHAQFVEQDFSQFVQRYDFFEVPSVTDPQDELTPVELHDYLDHDVSMSRTTIAAVGERGLDGEVSNYQVESYRVELVLGEHNDLRRVSNRNEGCIVTHQGTQCYTASGKLIIDAEPFPEDGNLFEELGKFIAGSPGSGIRARSSFAVEIGEWPYATDTVHLRDDSTGARLVTLIREPLQVVEYLSNTSTLTTHYRYDRFLKRTLPAREEWLRHTTTRSGLPAVRRTVAAYGAYFDPAVEVEDLDRLPAVLYPNPVTDRLYLAAAAGGDVARVEVRDALGILRASSRNPSGGLDVADLPAGTYTATVVANDGTVHTSTFIKQ